MKSVEGKEKGYFHIGITITLAQRNNLHDP